LRQRGQFGIEELPFNRAQRAISSTRRCLSGNSTVLADWQVFGHQRPSDQPTTGISIYTSVRRWRSGLRPKALRRALPAGLKGHARPITVSGLNVQLEMREKFNSFEVAWGD